MMWLMSRMTCVALCLLSLPLSNATAYNYPFADPYTATVINTPAEYAAALPADIPVQIATLRMFPDRKVPGILWNLDDLRYSYVRQKGPAPLIFLVAGTGASFASAKMQDMQKAFYQAGYHVVCLSSPTHPNFIVAASTSGVPGHLGEDSADLYRVMRAVWQQLGAKVTVTEFYLSGYSLGAAQAAFIARLDERERSFNFSKVLLINPPVSLYNSVLILDELLEKNIPGGLDNFNLFYDRVVNAFAEVYAHGEGVEFNDQFLFKVYQYRKPKSEEPLAALIGTDFRLSSQNMAFTSDVMTRAGYVVPKNLVLDRHDNVRVYAKVLARLTFLDYFEGILLPHFQAADPSVTADHLIEQMSLHSLDDYLRSSPKFGLIHNADDLILKAGEIDYLRNLFGKRARIFPHGGHCGNMSYPDNVAAMVGFFQGNGLFAGGE